MNGIKKRTGMTQVHSDDLGPTDAMKEKAKEFEQKKLEILSIANDLCDRHDVLKNEHEAWGQGLREAHEMIRCGYSGKHVLSHNGKEVIRELISQGEENIDLLRTEMKEIADKLQRITDQVKTIDDLLGRLKNFSYLAELEMSKRERIKNMNAIAGNGSFTTEFETLERNIRRLEYTTDAFLELASGK